MVAPWLIRRTPNGGPLNLFGWPERKLHKPPELIYHGEIHLEPFGEVETDVSWKLPKTFAERDFRDAVAEARDVLDRSADFGDLRVSFPNLPNSIKLIYPLPKTTTESTPLFTEKNALEVLN
ncbi:hypothetical protein AAVH_37111 [Aphelenchoides avenae]|nr:hypothetical protein AAVH_37111 [Aphelenchus avenae]